MSYTEGSEIAEVIEWIEAQTGIEITSSGRGVEMRFIVLNTDPNANLSEIWAKIRTCTIVTLHSYEALWVFEEHMHVHKMVIHF